MKNQRIEIRISEEEREILEKIKSEAKKNTSDLFREFLNSYDLKNQKLNLKKTLETLQEEKKQIHTELSFTYQNLRETYLPYRLAFDLLRANKSYFIENKDSIRYEDYQKFLSFQDLVENEKRLKDLDLFRTRRDSLKSKLRAIENKIYKLKGY